MEIPLGKATAYGTTPDPAVLFPIERQVARQSFLGKTSALPFEGTDIWNCYELSWINPSGIPQVGIATLAYDAASPYLIESKSLKLFLGSLASTQYESPNELSSYIARELSSKLRTDVDFTIFGPGSWGKFETSTPPGMCVEDSIVSLDTRNFDGLAAGSASCSETIHSNLLRSLCPVTGQPDWGTVVVRYTGRSLAHASLVAYLTRHRGYQGFHEECCERLFMDLYAAIEPRELAVGCYYTRRGGIDINPVRYTRGMGDWLPFLRHPRQ